MIGLDEISKVVGRMRLEQIRASDLPQRATLKLLALWTDGSPNKLRSLAQKGDLLPHLRTLRANLEDATNRLAESASRSEAEALTMAGLPLVL